MNRKLLWAVFAIGLVLVITPFALLLPTKASAGEDMLNGFQPIMQPDQVATTARYYNDVFVPLGQVTPMMSAKNLAKFQGYMKGFEGMQADSAKLVPLLAQALHMTPAQVQQMMAQDLPSMAAMLQTMPQMQRDFGGLLTTMQQNERHLRPGPRRARALPAARRDDAGERRQLQGREQSPVVPAVRLVLRDPGRAARGDFGLWALDGSYGRRPTRRITPARPGVIRVAEDAER